MCHLIPAYCNNADILIHLDRCCWSVRTECSWPLQYLGPHSAALCTMKLIFLVAVLPQFPVQFSCWVPFPSTCLKFKNLCAAWTVPCMGKVNVFMHVYSIYVCVYIYIYMCVCVRLSEHELGWVNLFCNWTQDHEHWSFSLPCSMSWFF